ncbi:MAG: hypothetical protein AB7F66_13400 [Bacteriovoracia bacterium]
MTKDNIPEDIRNFVLKYIDTVELLSILLLLKATPEKEWTSEEIENVIRSSSASIERRLSDLYSRGILTRKYPNDDRHVFSPKTKEISDVVDKLVIYNITYPYRLINLIYSKPAEALRTLADAFRVDRKDENK